MFSAANKITVSRSLLTEVATSGAFPDPTLFVYGVLGVLVAASLLVGYAFRASDRGWRQATK
jgi:hypothetical protein